eukprot:GHVR01139340.1.p1 GENE.GHVR01139340.1~~GHVR01139340.1.p1  ORF type:complete len:682 (+),score=186.73 GHVR01139340.1:183-2228(+)
MPTASPEVVRKIVEEELGRKTEDIFDDFNFEAMASASIAQVHSAYLKGTRKKVVVKVQHEHVKQQLGCDLETLIAMIWWYRHIDGGMDFGTMLEEWQKEARKELDFRNEKNNQERAKLAFERGNIETIVPSTYSDLCTERVLVMDFSGGFKVTDMSKLKALQVDTKLLMAKLCDAFAYQVHVDGMFHGDPHPGNILVDNVDGEWVPVLLDWGLVKVYDIATQIGLCKVVYCLATLDMNGMVEAFEDMGFIFDKAKREDADPEVVMEGMRYMMSDQETGNREQDDELRQAKEDLMKSADESNAKERIRDSNPVQEWPQSIVLLARTISLIYGLTSTLECDFQFLSPMTRRAVETLETRYLPESVACAYAAGRFNAEKRLKQREKDIERRKQVPPSEGTTTVISSETFQVRFNKYMSRTLRRFPPPERVRTRGDTPRARALSKLEGRVHALLCGLHSSARILGCQVALWKDGRMIVDTAVGQRGPVDLKPVTPSTLFSTYGISNALTATTLLWVIERGVPSLPHGLDTPINHPLLWPHFDPFDNRARRLKTLQKNKQKNINKGNKGNDIHTNNKNKNNEIELENILKEGTIRDLLCHTLGLHRHLPSDLRLPQLLNFDSMVKHIEKVSSKRVRSSDMKYCQYCWLTSAYVVSEVVKRATGYNIHDLFNNEFAIPLGLAVRHYQ